MPKLQKRKGTKPIALQIDGIKEVPLEIMGLSIESIEESNGRIIIPKELLPYIKFHKYPKVVREIKAKQVAKYRLTAEERKRKKKLLPKAQKYSRKG